MLNIFAGLFQNLFNLLAASLSVPTKTGNSSDSSALHWLHSAKRVHELYLTQNLEHVGPTFWETIQFRECIESLGDRASKEETESEISPERLLFEHGYTSTIFLLAQVSNFENSFFLFWSFLVVKHWINYLFLPSCAFFCPWWSLMITSFLMNSN